MRFNRFFFRSLFLFGDAPEDWRVTHNEIVDAAKDNLSLRMLAQDSLGFLCRWAYEAHALGWTVDRLYGVDPLDQFGELVGARSFVHTAGRSRYRAGREDGESQIRQQTRNDYQGRNHDRPPVTTSA